MGVTGLWRLVEPAGKPVPVETLENKVLAVDISIWLHQMVKGYQDAKGAPLANAHLMGLFQRVCKLLYFRIKPVFVFDGGFPELKRETIAKRQDNKSKYNSESERLKRELALILGKKTAIGSLLGKQISPKKGHAADASNNDDIFKLPALPQREEMESESEDESDSSGSTIDLHSVDLGSDNFKSLPVKEKYDLLLELKETRKMNSWGKLHELPKKSDNFSDFQMQRLLKRRKVQECLEETEKEMGDSGMSLNDLESLLNEEGIDTKIDSLPTRRIASNNNTRFLLINDVKQALAEAKKKREAENQPSTSKIEEESTNEDNIKPLKRDELEDDLEKAIKMSLECVNEVDTSACTSKTDDSWTSVMTDSDDTDSEEEDGHAEPDLSSAKAYIMQYSDFTRKTIDDIVTTKHNSNKGKCKVPKVDKIIDELNKEKSVIVDNVELSSDDDCGDNPKAPNKITSHENVLEDNSVDTSYPTVISTEEINPIEKSIMNQLELKSKNEPKLCIDNKSKTSNKSTGGVLNQSIIELDTSEDFECSIHDDDNVDETQASIMCIEDRVQDIITLDTSTEEDGKLRETPLDLNSKKQDFEKSVESDSSDDEFEDVPEIENKTTKPVVQLTLNIMDETLDDDLFADVFADKKKPAAVKPSSVENTVTEIVKQQQAVNKDHEKKLVGKISEVEMVEISNNKTVKIINQSASAIQDNSRTNQPQPGCSHESDIKNTTKISREMDAMETDQPTKEPPSTETLNTMVEELQNEEQVLLQEKGRLDRIGRNITEQMTQEAQELLQIFGIPYIVAPTEAEAQCAFLESVKLTDGTITDDSDIWLFGGRTVYKNFFNQKKHVLQFLAERIERSFNLTREQLVLLALLVGSDYTTGVTGVGPVTALEILAWFPFNKKQVMNETSKQARFAQMVGGLQEFKKWMQSGKKTDNTTLKKKLKNVDLTNDFPSIRVVQAYLEPNVEKSEEKFTWGELDTTVLRDYTKAKFGWSQNKLDEIIKPVLKRIQDSKSQRSVQDYFKRKIEFQSLEEQMSKRVKAAVQKMGPEAPIEQPKESAKVKAKPTRKRKVNSKIVNETEGCNIETKQSEVPSEEKVLNDLGVRAVSHTEARKSSIEIKIPKTDRVHEIIPQREKEKQSHLQNKMKAIEIFRKTKMDRKKKPTKKRANLPKEKADLSESSDCD